ncbi:MAG: vgr related protein [Erythrobacter sp.]|uniref:vgr related protein n=1 Tax=Erythrobacter sp. TaxID=1042 RepID=UPI002604EF8F|nr:vgr related protein [Erythrobacter sp.]MDJ0977716.1 vgr related protein [Erythrobacter sp.]
MARSVFGAALDYEPIRLRRRKWFPFQPRKVTMAPRGHIHFHPSGSAYCDDFSRESVIRQGLLIHELVHVWQTQKRGQWYLILNRHPFCRYDYALRPGQPLSAYGIEQQAMIVQHAFWLRQGLTLAGVADKAAYDALVNFEGASLG